MAIKNRCHIRHKPYTKVYTKTWTILEFDTYTTKCEEPQS
jgi:hypothetical protein